MLYDNHWSKIKVNLKFELNGKLYDEEVYVPLLIAKEA